MKEMSGRLPGGKPATVRLAARTLTLLAVLCALLSGCVSHSDNPPAPVVIPPPATSYDADSWKALIPAGCERYSDGCNLCNRNPDSGMTACTRKACPTYQKPECLDDGDGAAAASVPLATRAYHCSGGQRFSVTPGEYVSDDQKFNPREDQLMLSDHQTRATTLLTRVVSASGARYKGDDLEFWSKGNEAMLLRGGVPLYWNCVYP